MKTRQEIKALAKQAMKKQHGTCILIFLVVMLIAGGAGGISGALLAVPVIGFIIYAAVMSFSMVLSCCVGGTFVSVYDGETVEVGTPFSKLSVNFMRKLGGMWWMALWVFLWMLLLYIPGIIKAIAYSMTPYILAECPNVEAKEALKLSMRMTDGHKGELFVMYLSFIGWGLLSSLTFGILMVAYVGPYMHTTMAGYYTELRDLALAEGRISAAELA